MWGFIVRCIPISLWGSPFWYGDSGIPVLVWVSPNRFGDSFAAHPHFALGVPVLVWGFGVPSFGLGIPRIFCDSHPHFGSGIPVLVWGSPNRYGDPQTKMGCHRIDSKTMMVTAQRVTTRMATAGATGDGATGYDGDNDGDWQRRERRWQRRDGRSRDRRRRR